MPRQKVSGENLKSLTVTESVWLSCKGWSFKVNRHMFELANAAWRHYESVVLKKEQKLPCPLCNSTVYDGDTPTGLSGDTSAVTKTEHPLQNRTRGASILSDTERRLIRAARAIVISGDVEAADALVGYVRMVEFVANDLQRGQGKTR